MKVIIDDKIPYIREAVDKIATETLYLPGSQFTPEAVKDADALIIRTRTHCNRELLEGSKIKFIATATIGYDHIDTEYCKEAGITWINAPGSNSSSVEQYVESSLLLLQKEKGFSLTGKTLGIVGVGNVGSKIARLGESYGMKVLLNDPPLQKNEKNENFVSLKTIATESDIITFHTPLIRSGEYNTYHLANLYFFESLKNKPVFINTSRGEVMDTDALLYALDKGLVSEAIVDVWENEPEINRELLEKAFISTPHIAGYSADGKANATRMALQGLCRYFNISETFTINPPEPSEAVIHAANYEEAMLKMYNPETDSRKLKEAPEKFELFRGDYPLKREKTAYTILTGVSS